MPDLHLTVEAIENIYKAVCTGNSNYVEKWYNKFPSPNSVFIKIAVNCIILDKYNSAMEMIKKFNRRSKNRHEDFFDNLFISNDANHYFKCIYEEKKRFNEKEINNTLTSEDVEIYYFLNKLRKFYEEDTIEKIIKQLNLYLKDK